MGSTGGVGRGKKSYNYSARDETKGLSLGEERGGERVGRSSGNLSHFLVGVLNFLIVFKYLKHHSYCIFYQTNAVKSHVI